MRKFLVADHVRGGFSNFGAVTFGHMSYQMLRREKYVNARFDERAFKLAFVRNPFERGLSLYFYFQKVGTISSEVSLLEFFHALEERGDSIGLFNARRLSQASQQVDWILNTSNQSFVDYIGDVERLDEHVGRLSEILGIQPRLFHENRTERSGNLAGLYHDGRCIDLVRKLYRDDFRALGYSTDPADALLPPVASLIGEVNR